MSSALTIASASLLGLAASGHCVVMCGGISSALSLATAKGAGGRPRAVLLLMHQLGRIVSYTMAGLLFGSLFGRVIALVDMTEVSQVLRIATSLMLLVAGLAVLGGVRDPGSRIGRIVWPRIAPFGRRLLPIDNAPRALAFGMVWGWMPCGFVYTVLLIATLQGDAWHAAAVMAAFGVGTLPALLAASVGAHRLMVWVRLCSAKHVAASVLLLSAVLTLAGPWLVASLPGLHHVH